jgi:hypothetical protein
MDDIRVHYNSDGPGRVHALADTQGADIHMAAGQEQHLPHEAWHVAQQKQGRVTPTLRIDGVAINDWSRRRRQSKCTLGRVRADICAPPLNRTLPILQPSY